MSTTGERIQRIQRRIISATLAELDQVERVFGMAQSSPITPRPTRSLKIAVCVGHSRTGDNGAASVGGVSEWKFNGPIAVKLAALLNAAGHQARVFDYYGGAGYGAAMKWIAGKIKDFGADIALELHFNSATPQANGYEYLYWGTSTASKSLAESFLSAHAMAFPAAKNRGPKPLTAADRGAGFLSATHCPAVICEPFFGSNAGEWEAYKNADLAGCYFDAIKHYQA